MDEHLISIVNKLQDALVPLGSNGVIDLPQITVVGSQSSGKSSVLENIVGRDFLPRGTGIVTRRPLTLQLTNVRGNEEWGEFQHIPGKKFTDFNEIRNEIVRETELKVGKNAGISAVPINLRIFSPHVLTLTLVDLPGLTKVPVGDQPKDIERQIKQMVLSFISKPNAIILAVTAANTDLANSDGLKLAREVDPEGTRTIGVLTKIDLMDRGTDVIDILAGKIIPLRLGYIPVINRGQDDIKTNKSIKDALDTESKFFAGHPSYSNKAMYCGTPYLAKRLNAILLAHIKATLPEIKSKIHANLTKFKNELMELGPAKEGNPNSIVLNAITHFCNEYKDVLDGKGNDVSSAELNGAARISYVFHETFANGVRALDPFDEIRDQEIRTVLYNASGLSPALFVGSAPFEFLVKKQITRFNDPAHKCVTIIFDELVRIVSQILNKPAFSRYPSLRAQISTIAVQFLRECCGPTNQLVADIVSMEESYINSGHPDLISGSRAMEIVKERLDIRPVDRHEKGKKSIDSRTSTDDQPSGPFGFISFLASKNKKKMAAMDAPPSSLRATGTMTEREQLETEVIKLLITSYFAIVQRTIADLVPKSITYNLIQHSKDKIQEYIIEHLYQKGSAESLVRESEATIKRRNECEKMVSALTKAAEVVSNV